MRITDPLILPEDVLIVPVSELADDVRHSIDCSEEDLAVTRLHSRAPSTVIDLNAARLLERFRQPTTIVEAAILFAREVDVPPEEVLETAYPLLRRFVDQRVLISAEDEAAAVQIGPSFEAGSTVAGVKVVRPIVILEDTELYLTRRESGEPAVLKCSREPHSGIAPMLENEARALQQIGGRIGPGLLGRGKVDARSYLLLEYVNGVDAHQAAAELREVDSESRGGLLALITRVALVYAELHDAGVVHGDVHPRNILVDGEGLVRLIDFGLADWPGSSPPESVSRGGVPFYMEPEYASRLREGQPPPRATAQGEQYALGALLYELAAGVHYVDFNIDRERMLDQIVETPVRTFSESAVGSWPSLEAVLARALAKNPDDRFASVRRMAESLEHVEKGEIHQGSALPKFNLSKLRAASHRILEHLGIEGALYERGLDTAPTASLTYGAAGIAYTLYRLAALTGDAKRIAEAQAWVVKAASEIGNEMAFFSAENELTPETIGSASPYHTASGIHAVQALIASVLGDTMTLQPATDAFLDASAEGANGLDTTLGVSSILLGTTLLLEAARRDDRSETSSLQTRGHGLVRALWGELDRKPRIEEADVEYLGAAHGWAGFLYVTLAWSRATDTAPPSELARRLDELAILAEPVGRGIEWPWLRGGRGGYMPGWCNGTAGYVFLWTLAAEVLNEARYTDLAEKAGWNVAEASDLVPSLCCGLLGRSYALLNLHKHTAESRWLTWAKRLTHRAVQQDHFPSDYPLSLYKGQLPLVLLDVELECPMESAQPFFESEIWALNR